MSIQSPTKESQEAMQAKTQAVPPMNVGSGLPEGGTVGQVLTKTATGSAWDDVPEELPEGGTVGQVLTKTATGSAWDDVPEELPEGGTTGQVLTKTANGCEWAAAPGGLPATSNSNKNQYLRVNPSNNSAWWTSGPTMLGSSITFTTSECFFDSDGPEEDQQQPVDNNVKVTLSLASGSSWPTMYSGEHFTPLFVRVILKDSNNYVYSGLLFGMTPGSEYPASGKIRLHGKLDLTSKSGSTIDPWGVTDYGYLDVILIKNQSSYWLYVASKSILEDA